MHLGNPLNHIGKLLNVWLKFIAGHRARLLILFQYDHDISEFIDSNVHAVRLFFKGENVECYHASLFLSIKKPRPVQCASHIAPPQTGFS